MNPMKHGNRPHSPRAGMTLIELMVTLTVGLIVIGGSYQIANTSRRTFAEQVRRAETQMTLRSATELLRRDIGRAGFFGVRTTNEIGTGGLLGTLGAGANNASPTQQAAAMVKLDGAGRQQLFLTGNFTTSDQFLVRFNQAAPTTLTFQNQRDAFQRAFLNPAMSGLDPIAAFLPERFAAAFGANPATPTVAQGRMVSVQDLATGRIFLRDILSLDTSVGVAPSLNIGSPLPIGNGSGGTITPNALGIAPITMYRYAVEDPTGDAELALAAGTTYMTGGSVNRFALVRREIDMRTVQDPTPSPIAGTARIVLDFLDPDQGFRIEAITDTALLGLPPTLVRNRIPETLAFGELLQVRGLVVQLIANSAERADQGSVSDRARALAGRRFMRFEVFIPSTSRNPQLRI